MEKRNRQTETQRNREYAGVLAAPVVRSAGRSRGWSRSQMALHLEGNFAAEAGKVVFMLFSYKERFLWAAMILITV